MTEAHPFGKRLATSTDTCGPFFGDEHRALAAELSAKLPAALPALRAEPADAARIMGKRPYGVGIYSHLVPDAPNGERPRDPEVRTLVVVREALAQLSPMADAIFAVQGLGSYPIAAFGTPEQRASILPSIVSGDRIAAFALTEPEAGTDVASLSTRAERQEDGGWILTGEKTLISNVGIAGHYVVFANADPPKKKHGITAFIVPVSTQGLSETPLPLSSPHPLGSLSLSGCRVPDSARVGDVGQGFSIAMRTLDAFRISVGAAANGMAARALSLATERVLARKQFGRPIADQQQVQLYLAEMATELEAARLLVAKAAWLKDTGGGKITSEAAMAKMYSTEAAQKIIDRAVQLFGGSGVLLGSEVEALYRDIRPLRIYEGTTEIQRVIIAKALLAGPG